MSEQTPSSMHETLDSAFRITASLDEKLADNEIVLDQKVKTEMRKAVNRLKGMMDKVLQFKEEVPNEVFEGMEEVIVNTEAKLDGKPMRFKADNVDEEVDVGAINQMAA